MFINSTEIKTFLPCFGIHPSAHKGYGFVVFKDKHEFFLLILYIGRSVMN